MDLSNSLKIFIEKENEKKIIDKEINKLNLKKDKIDESMELEINNIKKYIINKFSKSYEKRYEIDLASRYLNLIICDSYFNDIILLDNGIFKLKNTLNNNCAHIPPVSKEFMDFFENYCILLGGCYYDDGLEVDVVIFTNIDNDILNKFKLLLAI